MLGGPPTAAEVTKEQPFTVRFFASETLRVCQEACRMKRDGSSIALTAVHSALVTLGTRNARPHEIEQRVRRRWRYADVC